MGALQSFSKWLQLKMYQVEVTFSVYIFTPWEKFFFWSVVFLLVSLTSVATILYLPQHIVFIISRIWFYIHGEAADFQALREKKAMMVEGVMSSVVAAVAGASATAVEVQKEL